MNKHSKLESTASDMRKVSVTNGDDAKGFINQEYFYGPVSVTNNSNVDLTELSVHVERFYGGISTHVNWEEYFEVYYTPEKFDLEKGKTTFVSMVYKPKKVSMPGWVITGVTWECQVTIVDKNGNKSRKYYPHVVFVMPQEDINITQKFLSKWKPDHTKNEYIYSYRLNLTSDYETVTDWYVFLDIPGNGVVYPAWLDTVSSWVKLSDYQTPVNNTTFVSIGDASHAILPDTSVTLDIQILYPDESEKYETLGNIGLNGKFFGQKSARFEK